MAPKSKPVFRTAPPFSETKWPEISPASQDIILDLLCNLLEPIGHYRKTHIQPSNGKSRSKKRKRTGAKSTDDAVQADSEPPPVPSISNHVLVGLNSVTRHLSSLAAQTAPPGALAAQKSMMEGDADPTVAQAEPSRTDEKTDLRPLSLIVLPHPMPTSSLPHAHLPTLVYLSAVKSNQPTRLVTLPTASEARLASMLHIPRVGAVGIMEGAPGAAGLVEYVREHVGQVECKWIEEALKAEWKGVKTTV